MSEANQYTKEVRTDKNGRESTVYLLDGKAVKGAEVPQEVKDSLEQEETNTPTTPDEAPAPAQAPKAPVVDADEDGDEDDGVQDDDPTPSEEEDDDFEDEDFAPTPKPIVQEQGMGFPRVKGKTVDIFDGETPHTSIRLVAGLMVPLTDENYKTKSEGEIRDKLKELGLLI